MSTPKKSKGDLASTVAQKLEPLEIPNRKASPTPADDPVPHTEGSPSKLLMGNQACHNMPFEH